MNKAKTAKVLTAAAAANLAIAGFAASPASAAAHSTATARSAANAETAASSAGKAPPGLQLIPADKVRTEKLSPQLRQAINQAAQQASTTGTKPRGFVPRASSSGMIPNTATGCNSHVCIGVFGSGLVVNQVWEHFWGWGGCHEGRIYWGNHNINAGFCDYSKVSTVYLGPFILSKSEYLCATFNGVPGIACEYVHR